MKTFLKYTVARLAILAVTFAVLWELARLLGVERGNLPFLLMASIIVSAVVSLFVLRSMRDDLAGKLQQRADRAANRVDTSRAADDID
jgi:hypothetical protein